MRLEKVAFLLLFHCLAFLATGQRSQRIGYIDMEYILEKVPGYQRAQAQILQQAESWRKQISISYKELQTMQQQLTTDEPLLTPSLIAVRKAAIQDKQEQISSVEEQYFGPKGQLFQMRTQLVRPIQDQVFNAIQILVKRKKYDFIFDKSGQTMVLYANPKYDVTRLVMSYIKKSLKEIELMEKREQAQKAALRKQERINAIKKRRGLK